MARVRVHPEDWQRVWMRWVQVITVASCLSSAAAGQIAGGRGQDPVPTGDRSSRLYPLRRSPSATVAVTQIRVPRKAQEQLRQARLLLWKGQIVEAEQRVERILSELPNYADALSVRARIRMRENRLPEAFGDVERALAEDPKLTNAYFALGEILNHEHRYAEALPVLEHCIVLLPGVWPCHYERARALIGTDQVSLALKEVEQAAAMGGMEEEPSAIYYLRRSVHVLLRDRTLAVADLEAFLRVCPSGELAERARRKLEGLGAGPQR